MRNDWTTRASCLDHTDLFMEQTHLSASEGTPAETRRAVGKAKQVCFSCPVRDSCLQEAMKTEAFLGGTERHGIRGGLTARERVLIAAKDPICARCRKKPVAIWQRVCHIRRLCRSCQREILPYPERKYFPELTT